MYAKLLLAHNQYHVAVRSENKRVDIHFSSVGDRLNGAFMRLSLAVDLRLLSWPEV